MVHSDAEGSVWARVQCVAEVREGHQGGARGEGVVLAVLSVDERQSSVQAAEEAEYGRVCFDAFRRLHLCIHAMPRHKDYYRHLVALRETDEEVDELDDDEDDWSDEADDE